jgi:signal transduction histidine kinase
VKKLGHYRLKALSIAVTALIFAVDLLTAPGLIVGVLYGIPVALAGLAIVPRWTWALVAMGVAGNLAAGAWANPEEGFNWDNRLLATSGIVLIGFLTTRIQQAGIKAGQEASAARIAAQELQIRRILGDLDLSETTPLLQDVMARLIPLFRARGCLVLKEGIPAIAEDLSVPSQLSWPLPNEPLPGWLYQATISNQVELISRGAAVTLGLEPPPNTLLVVPLGQLRMIFLDPASPEAPELARRVSPQLSNLIERTRRNGVMRDLAYSLSHDLRTPLTANLLNLRLAASGSYGPLPTRYLEALEHGIESNQTLLGLADDLLRLSLYETGQIRNPINGVPIKGQIAAAGRSMASLFASAEVGLALPDNDAAVIADPGELIRAFSHLLDNALHHSLPGSSVEVSIEQRNGRVRLAVADRGPGVSESTRPFLFNQLRPPGTEKTGIGLFLTARIARAYGGEAGYSPRPGGGSIFYIDWLEARNDVNASIPS